MKIVSPNQMSEIDAHAYQGGASETDFMEEAGSGVALVVQDYVEKHNVDRIVILLCGKGNNGGDAYIAGTHLLHLDYDVFAVNLNPIEDCSPLCRQSYQRFIQEGGKQAETLIEFPSTGIIVDGLFGTGFQGTVKAPYSALISLANNSGLPIISIDIPSGLNGETGVASGETIIASETAFLGLPKLGFFLKAGYDYTGKLRYVNYGLEKKLIDEVASEFIMLSDDILQPLMPPIKRSRHKYEAGLVVGVAGSPGMPGAAILSCSAALRGGAGIVRLYYPDGMQGELFSSPYELIRMPFHPTDDESVLMQINKARAAFIGPGLGSTPEIHAFLERIIPNIKVPCVIDADALNFLAIKDVALPKQTIMTPHHKEMLRLLNLERSPENTLEWLKTCQDYAAKKNVTLVLKGAPTFIIQANTHIMVNSTGDPGMATAGSGDVLTGLIASLLAQGMTPQGAACLGCFLHGLAGEHAAEDLTSYGVTASDIIYHFAESFKFMIL